MPFCEILASSLMTAMRAEQTTKGDIHMSDVKEYQLEINKVVSTLKTNLRKLRSDATHWQNTQFKTANESLYSMFAELYSLYEKCKDNIDDDVETQVRKYLKEACNRKNVTFKATKPTLQALLVKYAFDDGVFADNKRISAYVRVFTLCTTLDEVSSSNIATWIAERGGIENVRQSNTANSLTVEERSTEGMKVLQSAVEQSSFENDLTSANAATKTDEVVLLVGIQQADGSVSIRHTIYAEEANSSIKGKTAIKNALANVYSKHKEAEEKAKKKNETEAKLESEADAAEEALKNSTPSTEVVEVKEAA